MSHIRSSGLFGLPANARSVDWVLVNDAPTQADVRVTVYQGPIGQVKSPLPPGALAFRLQPGEVTHNANSVGSVFSPGFPFEVVVESSQEAVLPTVEVWSDLGATVIPGTRIGPDGFVSISDRLGLGALQEVRIGAKGVAVRRLQGLLRASVPSATDKSLPIDGTFGNLTLEAVKSYQQSHHLVSDGIVRVDTWKGLLGV